MTRKSVGFTAGILGVVLLGIIVATLPRRAGGQDEPKPTDDQVWKERVVLRGKVIEFRSKIEILRMENEAARPHLLAMMKLQERITFLEEADLLTPAGSVLEYSEAVSGDSDSLKEALAEAMTVLGPDEDFQKQLDDTAKDDLDRIRPAFQAALRHMKADFTKRGSEIAGAEFDLAEAEQHYQSSLEPLR